MSEDKECRAAFEVDFCGNSLVLSARAAEGFYIHPLTDHRWKAYQAAWNRRAAKPAVPAPLPSPENVRELAEEYCDVLEEYERDREWRFGYSGLQNFAVALLSAAPAQGKWLTEEDMAWLIRFSETCEDCDAGGYDVPKDRMRRLAEIGAVRSLGFGRYETTAFGNYVVETHFEQKSPLPLLTYDDHAKNAATTPPAAPKEPT